MVQVINKDDFEKDFSSTVQWNTEPLLGNLLTVWKPYWSAKTFIKWHEAIKSRYGKQRANEVFLIWWNKIPFGSPQLDFRTFNPEFIAYAKDNGFYDSLFSGVLAKVAKVGGSAIRTTEKILDSGSKVIEGAGTVVEKAGNTFTFLSKYIIWIVVILIVGFLIVKLANK